MSAPSTNGVTSGRDGDAGLVALPGERLSKAVGNLTESDLAAAEVFTLDDLGEPAVEPAAGSAGAVEGEGTELREDEAGRRRRRRGGRGRGRGRGRDEAGQAAEPSSVPGPSAGPAPLADFDDDIEDADDEPAAPRGPRTTPFGSVWDSQLGTSAAPAAANLSPLSDDDEDFDEPEIPEYLIAEQRRGAGRAEPAAARVAAAAVHAADARRTSPRSNGSATDAVAAVEVSTAIRTSAVAPVAATARRTARPGTTVAMGGATSARARPRHDRRRRTSRGARSRLSSRPCFAPRSARR